MWVRNGGLFAALLGLISFVIVAVGTWFALTHRALWAALMDECSTTGAGAITLLAVLAAGALLEFAFGRVEQALVLFKELSSSGSEENDDRD